MISLEGPALSFSKYKNINITSDYTELAYTEYLIEFYKKSYNALSCMKLDIAMAYNKNNEKPFLGNSFIIKSGIINSEVLISTGASSQFELNHS